MRIKILGTSSLFPLNSTYSVLVIQARINGTNNDDKRLKIMFKKKEEEKKKEKKNQKLSIYIIKF